jgi:DNA-binding transcriptional LysR family regulator
MEDVAGEPVVAHNDPSPARERVLRLFEEHHVPLNMVISLPSLDGIKRAVELKLGVAMLPRRCAVTEIASGRLVAIPVNGVSRKRQITLVCPSPLARGERLFLLLAGTSGQAGRAGQVGQAGQAGQAESVRSGDQVIRCETQTQSQISLGVTRRC